MSDTIGVIELRDDIGNQLNRVHYQKKRLTITRRGEPIAAVVPISDLAILEPPMPDPAPDLDTLDLLHAKDYGPRALVVALLKVHKGDHLAAARALNAHIRTEQVALDLLLANGE
jgi:prevent-host-death family protein